ncbi:MAG: hypothetical protein VYA55_16980 [Pseudomonadota bacterium]|nr:hypothetical protein [Pseudomonadota bacterium]
MTDTSHAPGDTPMERIEQLCEDLRAHYQQVDDCELRIAAKVMLVALDQFQRWGGPHWKSLVQEYVDTALEDPEKFQRILQSNRSLPLVHRGYD